VEAKGLGDNQIKKILHKAFEIGILLKALNGLLEIGGGILLFWMNPATLNKIVILLTQSELSEDPKDIIANFLLKTASEFSVSTQLFGIVYLLSHGIIKIFLVTSLWQRRLWAYPAAIVFFTAFCIYQMYRYYFTHSTWLIFLTVLDLFVIVLTWIEYHRLKNAAPRR
jgi:uncharacterized membrane protein